MTSTNFENLSVNINATSVNRPIGKLIDVFTSFADSFFL